MSSCFIYPTVYSLLLFIRSLFRSEATQTRPVSSSLGRYLVCDARRVQWRPVKLSKQQNMISVNCTRNEINSYNDDSCYIIWVLHFLLPSLFLWCFSRHFILFWRVGYRRQHRWMFAKIMIRWNFQVFCSGL